MLAGAALGIVTTIGIAVQDSGSDVVEDLVFSIPFFAVMIGVPAAIGVGIGALLRRATDCDAQRGHQVAARQGTADARAAEQVVDDLLVGQAVRLAEARARSWRRTPEPAPAAPAPRRRVS